MQTSRGKGVEIRAELKDQDRRVLTPEAITFLSKLHQEFNGRRLALLQLRAERQARLNAGERPDFLAQTKGIRDDSSWRVAPTPACLERRWVEITGPTDRKMIINALNSGADVYMADFEDANTPMWESIIQGQANLCDAVDGTISVRSAEGKEYTLQEPQALLFVRPRGWHLHERHFLINQTEMSGSLFDFGLFFFHNAKKLMTKGKGPFFYLPKLESHHEAKLWNDVFVFAQRELGIPQGSIRATVLIETILAAFEMEEILYHLKDHSAGLNAGRWDYIFSIIKKFQADQTFLLPDRSQITMTVPFMRAYTELLVHTCHRRGAHAMGGMAAFVPNKKDPEINEKALTKVREDKLREVNEGFDGTWVAHPGLVPLAREVFASAMGDQNHQKMRYCDPAAVSGSALLNFTVPGGRVTLEGIRHNINVALQYLASWLTGKGAVTIYNLMEDTATAEISRAQVWQWLHHGAKLEDGTVVTQALLEKLVLQEEKKIAAIPGSSFDKALYERARSLLNAMIFDQQFIDFLTIPAYKLI